MADSFTTSRPSEWDSVLPATTGKSHRATTSSRHPGRVFEGTVTYQVAQVVPCEKCGRPRRASVHPHSVLVHREGERTVRRDCVGDEV